jgi:hypothetical protein
VRLAAFFLVPAFFFLTVFFAPAAFLVAFFLAKILSSNKKLNVQPTKTGSRSSVTDKAHIKDPKEFAAITVNELCGVAYFMSRLDWINKTHLG